MITFPNAKINLGLDITSRLPNGYHTIDSVMYPIGWCDILEITPASGSVTTLHVSGRGVDCPMERNLVIRAYRALADTYDIPAVNINLHKIIPDGAGLGGGSSDASFTLRMLRDMYCPETGDDELADIAGRLGADCPFFIYNKPVAVSHTGTVMNPCDISLAGMTIAVVKPEGSVSTAEAYAGVTPTLPSTGASEIVRNMPVSKWRNHLKNDFEMTVGQRMPICVGLKSIMYDCGAVYAQMSGSGSAIYGIFDENDTDVRRKISGALRHVDGYEIFVAALD